MHQQQLQQHEQHTCHSLKTGAWSLGKLRCVSNSGADAAADDGDGGSGGDVDAYL